MLFDRPDYNKNNHLYELFPNRTVPVKQEGMKKATCLLPIPNLPHIPP